MSFSTPAPTTTETSPCAVCSKDTPLKCGRCKAIHYCDRDCQKADYKTHKIICRAFSDFDMSTRPSPNHHLAFVFPAAVQGSEAFNAERAQAKPTWIKSEYDGYCHVSEYKEIKQALGNVRSEPAYFLDNSGRSDNPQERFITLWCDEEFQLKEELPRNSIIDKLRSDTRWRGTVLIETGFGDDGPPDKYCDMKRIKKFFKEYPVRPYNILLPGSLFWRGYGKYF